RCKSVWQTERDRIVNVQIARGRPEQDCISFRPGRRHDLAIESSDDRCVGVIWSNLMIKSSATVDARKVRLSVTRARHLPVARCRWKVWRPNIQAAASMRGTYFTAL